MPLQTNIPQIRLPIVGFVPPVAPAPLPPPTLAAQMQQIFINTTANLLTSSLLLLFSFGYSIGISKMLSIPYQFSAAGILGIISINDASPHISNHFKFIAKQIMTLSIFTFWHTSFYWCFNFDGYESLNLPFTLSTQLTAPFLYKAASSLSEMLNTG